MFGSLQLDWAQGKRELVILAQVNECHMQEGRQYGRESGERGTILFQRYVPSRLGKSKSEISLSRAPLYKR